MALLWRLDESAVSGLVSEYAKRTGKPLDLAYEDVLDHFDHKDFLNDVISTMDYLLDSDIGLVFEEEGVPTYVTPDDGDVLQLTTEEVDDILDRWGVVHTEEQRLGFYAALQNEDVLVVKWHYRAEEVSGLLLQS